MDQTLLTQLEDLKILVTGGAGFIGSNLCELLLENQAKVICLDNFATGFYKNIAAFTSHPNFTLIEGDIRDLEICKQSTSGVDYVLHQAALGSVPRSIKDPLTTNGVNISGFLNMITAAKDQGVKRFVYAASSSTYGDSPDLPKVEEKIGRPLSPYAITKYVNELYADVFFKTYGFDSIGLRYFNVYGKRQDPNGAYAAVIPKFIKQLIKKESVTINGDGSFSRDFTYIDNVLDMNVRAMLTTNRKAVNEVYNVACSERTDLKSLVRILKNGLSTNDSAIKDVEVTYGPTRAGDVPHSLASIDKARLLLGYSDTIGLKEGLEKSYEWYWNNL